MWLYACGLMETLIILLKVSNVLTVSWWWVLCPIWIPVAVIFLLIFISAIYCSIHDYKEKKYNERPEVKAKLEKQKQRWRDGMEAVSKMSIEANRMIEKERQEKEEREEIFNKN